MKRSNILKIQDIIKLNVNETNFREIVYLSDSQLTGIIDCVALLIDDEYKKDVFKISVNQYLRFKCFHGTDYRYNDTLEKLMDSLDLMLKEL